MENVGYKNLVLYFPVPNETLDNGHVTVRTNGEKVNYSITWEFIVWGKKYNYTTLLGRLPLIKWVIKDAYKLKKFIVEVLYDYNISFTNDTKTIYALGTGRYYYTYSKQVITDIFFHINGFNNTLFRLFYADPFKKEETLIQATITNDTYNEHIRLFSPMFSSFKEDLLIELKQFDEEKYSLSNYFESRINIYINDKKDTLCIDGKAYLSNLGTIISTLDSYVFDNNNVILNITVLQSKSPSIQTIKRISFKNYVYLKNKMTHPYTIVFIINGKKVDNITIQPGSEHILLRDHLIKYRASPTITTITTTTTSTSTTIQTTTTTTTKTTPPITSKQTTTSSTTTTTTKTMTQTTNSLKATTATVQLQLNTTNSINNSVKEVTLHNTVILGVLVSIIILITIIVIRKKYYINITHAT